MSNPFCNTICQDCNCLLITSSLSTNVTNPTPFSLNKYFIPHMFSRLGELRETRFVNAIDKYKCIIHAEGIILDEVRELAEQFITTLENGAGVCEFLEQFPSDLIHSCVVLESKRENSYFSLQNRKNKKTNFIGIYQAILDDILTVVMYNHHPFCLKALIENGICFINQKLLWNTKYKWFFGGIGGIGGTGGTSDIITEISITNYIPYPEFYFEDMFQFLKQNKFYYRNEIINLLLIPN